jgi:hypothetical protein
MHPPALLGAIRISPPRAGDGRPAWAASGLRQTRLTRTLAWPSPRGITRTQCALPRLRRARSAHIGRRTRCGGVYADLSNTRSAPVSEYLGALDKCSA